MNLKVNSIYVVFFDIRTFAYLYTKWLPEKLHGLSEVSLEKVLNYFRVQNSEHDQPTILTGRSPDDLAAGR